MLADGRRMVEDLGFRVEDLAEPGSSTYQLVLRRWQGLGQSRASELRNRGKTGVGGKGCWRARVIQHMAPGDISIVRCTL